MIDLKNKTKIQNLIWDKYNNAFVLTEVTGESQQNIKLENTTKLQNLVFDEITNSFKVKII